MDSWKYRAAFALCSLSVSALQPVTVSAQTSPATVTPEIKYAPVPTWVKPAEPIDRSGALAENTPVILGQDFQILSDSRAEQIYSAVSIELLRPEGLALGNINMPWFPSSGDLIVHYVRIVRDGEQINVLDESHFQLLNAEQNVEASILSGAMVANLQIPGLRVGDRIEYAATTVVREPALPDQRFFNVQAPVFAMPGSFRARVEWDAAAPLHWQTTEDISAMIAQGDNGLQIAIDNPTAVEFPDNAPARYGYARLVEFSDFADWPSVSRRLEPLYRDASLLAPDSPLKARAREIAERYDNPRDRASAALALVQDEVRYVYVGMNGSNLRPATADQTWRRRYGDCKGKTVMLLALLAELGIEAQAVAVSSTGGDGVQDRLPNPGLFNHVLVRATIDGQQWWMDGTIPGYPKLLAHPLFQYRQVLPLTQLGSGLESLPVTLPDKPDSLEIYTVDARGGYDVPAKVQVRHVKRGAEAIAYRTALQAQPSVSAKSIVAQYFKQFEGWYEQISTDWKWHEQEGVLELILEGSNDEEWETDEDGSHETTLTAAGFSAPRKRQRTGVQDQRAPWANSGEFTCQVVTTYLPEAGKGLVWDHDTDPMEVTIGGIAYWRVADLRDGSVRTVQSIRTDKPEISWSEAEQANRQIADFDNLMSSVFEAAPDDLREPLRTEEEGIAGVPTVEEHDWISDAALCSAGAHK